MSGGARAMGGTADAPTFWTGRGILRLCPTHRGVEPRGLVAAVTGS